MTIFELSKSGRTACPLQKRDVEEYKLDPKFLREADAMLPEVDELTLVRHYTALSKKAFGVDDGFYPLGSMHHEIQPQNQRSGGGVIGIYQHTSLAGPNAGGA